MISFSLRSSFALASGLFCLAELRQVVRDPTITDSISRESHQPAKGITMHNIERDAAQVALIALQSAVPTGTAYDPSRLVLSASTPAVLWLDAINDLADRPKPLSCSAFVDGGLLNVRCRDLDPAHSAVFNYQLADVQNNEGAVGSLKVMYGNENSRALIIGGEKRLLVGFDAFMRWFTSYYIDEPTFSISTRPANYREQREGASCVIDLGRAERFDPTGIPRPSS